MTFSLMVILSALGFTQISVAADNSTVLKQTKEKAEVDYKLAHDKCQVLKDNEKDVCQVQAKSARIRTEENAEASYTNTLAARTKAAKKIAKADYDVDKTKCMVMIGNERDVCVKKAKSTMIASIATAKANKEVSEARSEEKDEKKTAEYKVALEKCDAVKGNAKDTCVEAAKKKYDK